MILTKEFILKRIKEQEDYLSFKRLFEPHYSSPDYKLWKDNMEAANIQLEYFKNNLNTLYNKVHLSKDISINREDPELNTIIQKIIKWYNNRL